MQPPAPHPSSRRRFLTRSAAFVLIALAVSAPSAIADYGTRDWPSDGPAPVRIEVTAHPITAFRRNDPSQKQFGALRFRSGLVLKSGFKHFGGMSAFRIDPDGQGFLAASDKGTWFTGRLIYRDGQLAGLTDVTAAPILREDGRPAAETRWHDAEAIARRGGNVYVALERVHRILKFDFAKDGVRARGRTISVPSQMRKLPGNKGIESLVAVPEGQPLAGALIAISERGLKKDENITAFIIGGPAPGRFAVRRTDYYDISDATLLADGRLLVLERKFSFRGGAGIRIRSIAIDTLRPGEVVDGPTLFEADLGHEIDNFEGIDAHVTADGETVLTLISDDNFSMIQRTLLMQFTLTDMPEPAPAR